MGRVDRENAEYKVREYKGNSNTKESSGIFARLFLSIIVLGVCAVACGYIFFGYIFYLGAWAGINTNEASRASIIANLVLILSIILIGFIVIKSILWIWKK